MAKKQGADRKTVEATNIKLGYIKRMHVYVCVVCVLCVRDSQSIHILFLFLFSQIC